MMEPLSKAASPLHQQLVDVINKLSPGEFVQLSNAFPFLNRIHGFLWRTDKPQEWDMERMGLNADVPDKIQEWVTTNTDIEWMEGRPCRVDEP